MGRIVVGVDGSKASDAALAWALEQARHTGDEVQALHAWQYPEIGEWMSVNPFELQHDELRAGAVQVLRAALERAGDHADVTVDPVVGTGRTAELLLEAARDADLLVVGSRGHGGFTGLLLGSVSQHCVHHATCPVVVVPERAVERG